MATISLLESTQESLSRVQQFEASLLSRVNDLGTQMSFSGAVEPANKLIDLYKRIPLTVLEDFSETQLNNITTQTQADYNLFNQILDFNIQEANATSTRTDILSRLQNRRDDLFNQLWQYIAYGVARNTDTTLLETQARATIQSIKDQSTVLTEQLTTAKVDAETALATIRDVASEQGVSQQAIYFKQEAENQEKLAITWLKYTYWFAIAVGVFAIFSLFLHKWEWIKPGNNAEMFQLVSSKLLIFAVLGYMLLMASRNYATHKHNAVVNRHRQNALLTYRALVEASTGNGAGDIVLASAASCIFSPQETGFNHRKGESSSGSNSVLELMINRATNSE